MPKLNFDKKEQKSSVEIVLQVRDHKGNPTGATKTFGSENHKEVSNWYNNQSVKKKKKKKKKKEAKK
tara:strand:- start:128 stop:328 length:201 start_codon:yes stop_codon:yes gene_type:complete